MRDMGKIVKRSLLTRGASSSVDLLHARRVVDRARLQTRHVAGARLGRRHLLVLFIDT